MAKTYRRAGNGRHRYSSSITIALVSRGRLSGLDILEISISQSTSRKTLESRSKAKLIRPSRVSPTQPSPLRHASCPGLRTQDIRKNKVLPSDWVLYSPLWHHRRLCDSLSSESFPLPFGHRVLVGADSYSLGPCDFLCQVCIRTAIFSADLTSCTQVHPCGRAGPRVAPMRKLSTTLDYYTCSQQAGLSSFNMGSWHIQSNLHARTHLA